jgi:nucleoside-diphosphate-sugar epimerase
MKVACEQLVRDGAASALVVRPGLIVGPHDPSGRFAYWPVHAARALEDGRPLLVPGAPDDPVQVVDVRDLAAWILAGAEQRLTGTFDGLGPSVSRRSFVAALAVGVGGAPELRWVPSAELVRLGVRDWAGEGSLPLWIGEEGYEGFMARDVSASLAAGLEVRRLEQTVHDTLAWLREDPDAPVTGLTREEELDLLDRATETADTSSGLS